MAASLENERSRFYIGGHCFLHSLGFNDRTRFGRESRSCEASDDSSESRSPRRDFKSRRLKSAVTRNDQQHHMNRNCFHGSVANHLENLHIVDHQTPLSEQSQRICSESNNISSHRDGIQLKNLITFSEQAIKNNIMHGAAMSARDRLHKKFKAASLLENRAENYVRSDKHSSLSGFDWENYAGHWLASNLQSENMVRYEQSECENLESVKADCPICLDSFLPTEQKIKLPCNHRFHIACLTQWFIIQRDCPYCRTHVPENH